MAGSRATKLDSQMTRARPPASSTVNTQPVPVRATFVTPGIHRWTDVRSPRTCRPGGTRTGALLGLAPVAASAAGQPIFYPVLNQDYAVKIVRDWNVRRSGAGYVTRSGSARNLVRSSARPTQTNSRSASPGTDVTVRLSSGRSGPPWSRGLRSPLERAERSRAPPTVFAATIMPTRNASSATGIKTKARSSARSPAFATTRQRPRDAQSQLANVGQVEGELPVPVFR